ncbi:MAG: DNA alkylation repair protein [Acidimicrobiales bacterium]
MAPAYTPGVVDSWADSCFNASRSALAERADPERAAAMAAYMKDRFAFFGVAAGPRREAVRDATRDLGPPPDGDALIEMARQCWAADQRELQYTAADALRRWVRLLEVPHLDDVDEFIVTKSWWDTVDVLAARVVGPLVQAHPELTDVMDRWIDDPHMWRRRTSIIHQLGYKDRTDADRLFAYCAEREDEREFFIAKAIGWALREYAKVDPDAVWAFVDRHGQEMAPLSVREATKHRGPGAGT